jgi:hypothetical protein
MVNIKGHVATTIMAAQTSEERKGRITQKLEAMRMLMKKTARVIRVMSDEWFFSIVCLPLSMHVFGVISRHPRKKVFCVSRRKLRVPWLKVAIKTFVVRDKLPPCRLHSD